MKILHVIPSVGPLRGGPSRVVLDLCCGLTKAGLDITLVTTDDNGSDRLVASTAQPIWQNGYEQWYFRRLTPLYAVSLSLLEWLNLNVERFDLVHVHAAFSHVSDFSPRILIKHQKPYGITPHGILGEWGMHHRHRTAKRLLYHLIVKPNLRHAGFVHFTSSQELTETVQLGEIPRAWTIPLGLPQHTDNVSVAEKPRGDGLRVLFMSRIDPTKGLEILLHAIAKMRQNSYAVRLTVAGDGKPAYVRSVQLLGDQLGISPMIHWVGHVDGVQKSTQLAQSDVFVLPSYSESFGMAPIEAMAVGLPVVISDHMGISSGVKQAQAGMVIPCDAEALAGALQRLSGDNALCRQLGANGRRLVQVRFSMEATVRSIIGMYDTVLQKNAE